MINPADLGNLIDLVISFLWVKIIFALFAVIISELIYFYLIKNKTEWFGDGEGGDWVMIKILSFTMGWMFCVLIPAIIILLYSLIYYVIYNPKTTLISISIVAAVFLFFYLNRKWYYKYN